MRELRPVGGEEAGDGERLSIGDVRGSECYLISFWPKILYLQEKKDLEN